MKKINVPDAEKLPSGSWRCRVMIDGKRCSFTATTKSEAEKLAKDCKLGYTMPKKESEKNTVSAAIDNYLSANEKSISPSTRRGYLTIKQNRFPELMNLHIDELTDAICQKAVNSESVSPKTIKNSWALVSSAIKYATGKTYVVYLPKPVQCARL